VDLTERIKSGIRLDGTTVMEIGALYRPMFTKAECDVIYVDHADTETLRAKYRDGHGFDVSRIVDVDAVWGEQSLAECLGDDRRVDYVVASHVIEHVPDLITWLNELSAVLKPGGEIRLAIPDKRFTFDYARRTTELAETLDAYIKRARRPLPYCIVDHLANVRHVDGGQAWIGPLDVATLKSHHTVEQAMEVARDAMSTDHYHDVHCWVFTPASFAALMRRLVHSGLVNLRCAHFQDTPRGTIEFTVFMAAATDRDEAISSWTALEMSANPEPWKVDLQPIEAPAIEVQPIEVQAAAAVEAPSSASAPVAAPVSAPAPIGLVRRLALALRGNAQP
jgi:SAM-dependent methyltransferase